MRPTLSTCPRRVLARGARRAARGAARRAGSAASAVGQACVMAFKRPAMAELFDAWRTAWNEWIYPTPFARQVGARVLLSAKNDV